MLRNSQRTGPVVTYLFDFPVTVLMHIYAIFIRISVGNHNLVAFFMKRMTKKNEIEPRPFSVPLYSVLYSHL